ncbi:alpha subunit of succinyl-CoA ligase [Hanseniaspora valbyensis NRRL Y-1626]|uniref:Alpha subunit of succinyl-CoA ligase n=1 Tax=Hanseniaspora valbyensis NRRL Y-1626 TaxID=766949 RepID=A0A1B7TAJ6_9ASCO|nr:alpha subunit of succinyl-CoA ligase [Hanseniaspora valbyensis NRRL Y-1626]
MFNSKLTTTLFKRLASTATPYEETIKNLKVPKDAKVLIQGFTGKQATFHSDISLKYGTNIVGGINPKKAGIEHLGKPVYASLEDYSAKNNNTNPDIVGVFTPPAVAASNIKACIEKGVPLVVCITEGIPQRDMCEITNILRQQNKTRLIGGNCPGLITPNERVRVGIQPVSIFKEGFVGIMSKSGTLTYEAVNQTTQIGFGQTNIIGIGGDPYQGTTFLDCLKFFELDLETKALVLLGEIGGLAEVEAAEYIKNSERLSKMPIVSFIAGEATVPGKRFGHAGAVTNAADKGKDTAAAKKQALRDAGVYVVDSPGQIGEALLKIVKQ